MSTQQAPSIEFSIASNFTNFQLVELPDELLTIITNHKDHETPVLQLKSEAQSGNAVLCTSNKTFQIRSVQTSNSLFVVQPAEASNHDEISIAANGLRAISSCGVTLELLKGTESALLYLRKALPIYTSRDLNAASAVKGTCSDICKDVPLSDGEVQEGWSALCAFEEEGASYRPSAQILLELWMATSNAATADGIDLTSAFLVEDLWISVRDQEFPRSMFEAVLSRIEQQNTMEVDSELKWCTSDKSRCSEWVAALILETRAVGDQAIAVSDFMTIWKDSMPERWRGDLGIEQLQKLILQPSPTTITLKPEHRLAGPPAAISSNVSQPKASTKAGKWHEKFKKTRT